MVGLSSIAPQTAEVLHLFNNFPSSPFALTQRQTWVLSRFVLPLSFVLARALSLSLFYLPSFSYSLFLSLSAFCAGGRDEWLRKEGAVRNWSCAGGVGGEDLVRGVRGVWGLHVEWGRGRWGAGAVRGLSLCLGEAEGGGAGVGVPCAPCLWGPGPPCSPCTSTAGSVLPPRKGCLSVSLSALRRGPRRGWWNCLGRCKSEVAVVLVEDSSSKARRSADELPCWDGEVCANVPHGCCSP